MIGQRGDGLGKLLVQGRDRAQARPVLREQGRRRGQLGGAFQRHPLEAVAPAVLVVAFFGGQFPQRPQEGGIKGTA